MIRGDCRREQDFKWYEKALEEQLSLTRLYEYFLYSLPADYNHLIPREVLLYFSYDHELDHHSRAMLYANVIQYLNEDSPIYRDYQKEMGRFAAEQVLQSRIDSYLAVVYDAVIYEDMVDVPIAKMLPSLLRSYRIRVKNPNMRQVVVCYEELTEEESQRLYEYSLQGKELTEYQERVLKLNNEIGQQKLIAHIAEYGSIDSLGIRQENAVIRGIREEQRKVHPMADARKQADEMMEAA